jgi:hypothetical protein
MRGWKRTLARRDIPPPKRMIADWRSSGVSRGLKRNGLGRGIVFGGRDLGSSCKVTAPVGS